MYHVNQINLKKDVTTAANACRRFFILEVEARIVAATLHVLGMKKIDDLEPTHLHANSHPMQLLRTRRCTLTKYLLLWSTNLLWTKREILMWKSQLRKCRVTYRHYPCRYPGRSKTFANSGILMPGSPFANTRK